MKDSTPVRKPLRSTLLAAATLLSLTTLASTAQTPSPAALDAVATMDVTTLVTAEPITTPTAMSTMEPREMNFLNPFNGPLPVSLATVWDAPLAALERLKLGMVPLAIMVLLL